MLRGPFCFLMGKAAMYALRLASPPSLGCKALSPGAGNNHTTMKAGDDVHVRRVSSGSLVRDAVTKPEKQLPVVSPGSLTSEAGRLIPNLACRHGNESYSYRAMEYLTAILSSNKVYDVAIETPLQLSSMLTARLGNNIWLKREDLQPDMFEDKRSILEPAGALSLAGAEAYSNYYNLEGPKHSSNKPITTGVNINFDKLRLVADVGRELEV
ncbi:PREDICTED: threonine dehydratase biosynthetic, chloroplastic-like [Ipomoea nil]|uniref:threonine dehydratase biosynthetic, chloroplastic-like n=1 Tax=Ipomoea nil TaxID=35883 RepID=UPI000900D69E|nr:PREDICTED: threonine dehydratase biosynthetic, chloroplastic-like [Ipomoea nil]